MLVGSRWLLSRAQNMGRKGRSPVSRQLRYSRQKMPVAGLGWVVVVVEE